MKKAALCIMAGLMALTASAQVRTSYSYVKEKRSTLWYGRIGVSINNIAGMGDYKDYIEDGGSDFSLSPRAGLALDFGFQRPMGKFGMYWGMELGIGSRGGAYKLEYDRNDYYYELKTHYDTWNVKYSPFTFGYKYSINEDWKIDAHLGIYASYDFAKSGKYSNDEGDEEKFESEDFEDMDFVAFDAGLQVGAGIWWKRFNLDFTYQRGFVPMAKYSLEYEEKNTYSSNVMIRFGVSF